MIEVRQLTHHYGVRPVLKQIELRVPKGELVVLIGPNGSGKTTLLGCIAGTICASSGSVVFDGVARRESASTERELRRKMAYLPDDTWLPRHHTGREFLLAVANLYGIDDFHAFEHADRLLALFHLQTKADAAIDSYSTGQRKKIALASALITEAPYLLLDEPFSGGLDPAGILALKSVLARLAEDELVTVVMTTPVPGLVEELADRVAVIWEGELIAFSTADQIKQDTGESSFDRALQCLLYAETPDVVAAYFGQ